MLVLNLLLSTATLIGAKSGRNSAQEFYEQDPTGIGMAIIAMSVVFMSLVLLFLVVNALTRLMNKDLQVRRKRKSKGSIETKNEEDISGEVNAAIALAIHMYRKQIHDIESFKLTIDRVSRIYSPWSSKLYGMSQTPLKKSR